MRLLRREKTSIDPTLEADSSVAAILAALAASQRIAIVRLGSVGDVIETVPFAWLLREVAPAGARISWISHPESVPLLESVPAIDEVVAVPRGTLSTVLRKWRAALAGRSFDLLFDLHGNVKSGVVAWLAHAKKRVGFARPDCRERLNAWFMTHHLPRLASGNKVVRVLEVGRRLGASEQPPRFDYRFPERAHARAREVLARVEPGRSVALLQLGRPGDVRSWPTDRYAELADELVAGGRHVIVTGGGADRASGEELRARLEGGRRDGDRAAVQFEVGTLDLQEIGALFQELAPSDCAPEPAIFVGPDGGCLHLAAACGMRVVGLFGPQDPDRTAPIAPRVTVLHDRGAAPCVPCARRECSHPSGNVCMKNLTSADVVAALKVDGARATPLRTPERTVEPRDPAFVPPRTAEARILDTLRVALSLVPLLLALLRDRGDASLLIDAAATGLIVYVTGSLAKRFGSPRTGLIAAVCLLLMEGYAWPDRRGVLDAVATACVAVSLYLYMEGVHPRPGSSPRRSDASCVLAAAAAVGVAIFVSGAAGLLLPVASLVFFEWFESGERRRVAPPVALASAAILAAAFVARRYALPAEWPADHATTWEACGRFLLLGLLPASLAVPFALFDHLKSRRFREDFGLGSREWRFPKLALLATLLLLLVPSLRPTTLTLVGPLLALLVAASLERRYAMLRPSRS